MPLLDEPGHSSLVAHLKQLGPSLPRPEAILLISAHWQANQPVVTSNPKPELIYDYYGFPPEAYKIQYSAPGQPQLASQVAALLDAAGFKAKQDPKRGWDHGTFVPLKLMYPDADIPLVQLSLLEGCDPEAHLRMGAALRPLRERGVLILGSGSSYHNLPVAMTQMGKTLPPGAEPFGAAFHVYLVDAVTKHKGEERAALLRDWAKAPGARDAQPVGGEEHLLPLMVAAGAAGDDSGMAVFDGLLFNARAASFAFGDIGRSNGGASS